MKDFLAVGIGGFVGAIARYSTGLLFERMLGLTAFPYATLIVNVAGCLMIGLLGGVADHHGFMSPTIQLLLIVGLLGGFTTYSAFGYQTISLVHEGKVLLSVVNVFAHLLAGLGAVFVGELIGKRI
jgi:CrcB protein